MAKSNLITGLDIGTSKICAMIGQLNQNGQVEILGVGCVPSSGLRKGVVVDLESTIKGIGKAVEAAEHIADTDVEAVYVGCGGKHIKSQPSRGVIAISRADKEITSQDVDRVIEQARAIPLPLEKEIIHILPQRFILDDQDGITDPVGMSGMRLETEVYIITGTSTSVQNTTKCINRAGFKVQGIVIDSLAASESVFYNDEKELGVALVDIGGGKIELAIFIEGALRFISSIGIGGNYITKDIAFGLRTSLAEAEEIKKCYGCAFTALIKDDDEIPVKGVGKGQPHMIKRHELCEIIEPRTEEMLELIYSQIQKSGFSQIIPAGVVFTGGTALMEGLQPFGEQVLDMPVRIGAPQHISGLTDSIMSPEYATAVGLIQYGIKEKMSKYHFKRSKNAGFFKGISDRLEKWLDETF